MKELKKQLSMLLVLALLLSAVCLLVGCENKDSDDISNPYIGDFHSVFVDSQTDDNKISFTLSIREDHTFVLCRDNGYRTREYSGSWKSFTDENQMQLLCLIEEGYSWSSDHPNAWHPYFSLIFLDDGTLMATPATTSSSSSVVSAFGYGYLIITLVLFEKD